MSMVMSQSTPIAICWVVKLFDKAIIIPLRVFMILMTFRVLLFSIFAKQD